MDNSPVQLFVPNRRHYEAIGNPLVKLDLRSEIEQRVAGVVNWVFVGPGVIVQSNQDYGLFGIKTIEQGMMSLPALDKYGRGRFISPQNLKDLIAPNFQGQVINGCHISIETLIKKDRNHDWQISISPDYDLKDLFPLEFDAHLGQGLQRALSSYIEKEMGDRAELVTPHIHQYPLMDSGSHFTRGYWGRKVRDA